MAYCRWSCDNGYSDTYVYEDVLGGWTTHIANMRRPPGAPEGGLEWLVSDAARAFSPEEQAVTYAAKSAAWREWADANPPVKWDHPEAGASYNHATPGECADNLERLIGEGVRVPDGVVEALRTEQAEMEA